MNEMRFVDGLILEYLIYTHDAWQQQVFEKQTTFTDEDAKKQLADLTKYLAQNAVGDRTAKA